MIKALTRIHRLDILVRLTALPVLICVILWSGSTLQIVSGAQSRAAVSVGPTDTKSNTVTNVSPTLQTNITATTPLTSAPPPGTTNSDIVLDDKHKLAIGDRLSFWIVEDEEDPKSVFVTDSGDIEVPYIGRVPAEGKTCRQLAADIKTELEKNYYYQATVGIAVDLMSKSRGKVYLVGAVRAAGPQDVPSDEVFTLSKAILRAGGFTDYADKHHVKITRKGMAGEAEDKTIIVDVAQVLEKGKTELDAVLEPGDFIYIPDRLIRF